MEFQPYVKYVNIRLTVSVAADNNFLQKQSLPEASPVLLLVFFRTPLTSPISIIYSPCSLSLNRLSHFFEV